MTVTALPAPILQVPPPSAPAPRPAPPERHPVLRRLSWLWVLGLGVAAYLVVLQVMLATRNVNYFPSLLLIGSITVPIATLVFAVTGGRRAMSTSTGLLVLTAVVGGLVGTVAAGTVEYATLRNLSTIPMLAVGLIEETAKLAVPLAIYLLMRHRDPREGVLVGIASGMGFATLETMGYGFQVLLAAHSIAAVDTTLLMRALLAPAGHIAWTGIAVAMLWRIRAARHRGRAIWAFAATFVAAVLLHAAWDSATSVAVRIAVAVVGLIALLVLVHRAHRVPGTPSRWRLGRRPTSPAVPDLPGPASIPAFATWTTAPADLRVVDDTGYWAVQPPSTGSTVPVTIPDDGEAR